MSPIALYNYLFDDFCCIGTACGVCLCQMNPTPDNRNVCGALTLFNYWKCGEFVSCCRVALKRWTTKAVRQQCVKTRSLMNLKNRLILPPGLQKKLGDFKKIFCNLKTYEPVDVFRWRKRSPVPVYGEDMKLEFIVGKLTARHKMSQRSLWLWRHFVYLEISLQWNTSSKTTLCIKHCVCF